MYDIVTFGSAGWDVFMKSKNIRTISDKNFVSNKGVCFNLGSKIDIEEMHSFSGGGGTNTAATFALQGFKTAFCGMVGKDLTGEQIIEELNNYGIDTSLVLVNNSQITNYSVILKTADAKDRTILVYRGASEFLSKENIDWEKIKDAKWFYLAPLSGNLAKITKDIVNFAFENNIKVAFNPGNSQLTLPNKILLEIIKKVNILILNQEEASFLTKVSYDCEGEIFRKIDEICPAIAIMTKGPQGVTVADGKYLYSAPGIGENIVDSTGAGDAFGSGFISGFIQKKGDIEHAIKLGLNNSTSCIQKWGAKEGLLKKGQKAEGVKIRKVICSGDNCKIKY